MGVLTQTRNIDVVGIVTKQQIAILHSDLEDTMKTPQPQGLPPNMEEDFELYRKAQKILKMGNAFST